ncbi:MAG TPA: sugar ABC transporter substrate-binding protein [Firmicutes bacterium]|nr:sugar ABC transporter substrate-binding protein [Bacillota bacterium]
MTKRLVPLVAVWLLLGIAASTLAAPTGKITVGWKGYDPVIEQLAAEFEARYPGTTVEIIDMAAGTPWLEKLQVLLMSGTAPDVVRGEILRMAHFIEQGAFLALDELIAHDPEFRLEDFFEPAIEMYRYKGKLYGLPREANVMSIFVNKDILATLAIPMPDYNWTYDDLIEMGRKIVLDVDGDGIWERVGCVSRQWSTRIHSFLLGFGTDLLTEDGSWWRLEEPRAIEALQFLQDAGISGAIVADSRYDFPAGNTAMKLSGPWRNPAYRTADFEWDIVPVPEGPYGRGSTLIGDGYWITKESQNVELAWEFIKFLTSAEAQQATAGAGELIPSNKEAFFSPWFLFPEEAPFNIDAYEVGLQYASSIPAAPRFRDFEVAIEPTLLEILTGRIPVEQALHQLEPVVRTILQ